MTLRYISLVLTFVVVHELHSSPIRIETLNATHMKDEQWHEVNNLWTNSFFNVYKSLPLKSIDPDIYEDSEVALTDWLERLFAKYKATALRDPYVFTFVYKDEQIAGYTLHHMLTQSQIMHIDHFVVSPAFQGQGIGKALLAAVIENNPGMESIVLTTRILNAQARGFYAHLGFYEIKERVVEFDPLYSVLLKKDIINSEAN